MIAKIDRSSQNLEMALAAQGSSPSDGAQQQELAALVADRLAELPHHYREVIVLRNFEARSFDEVAEKMGRTPVAVRHLWVRAIERLRLECDDEDL